MTPMNRESRKAWLANVLHNMPKNVYEGAGVYLVHQLWRCSVKNFLEKCRGLVAEAENCGAVGNKEVVDYELGGTT